VKSPQADDRNSPIAMHQWWPTSLRLGSTRKFPEHSQSTHS